MPLVRRAGARDRRAARGAHRAVGAERSRAALGPRSRRSSASDQLPAVKEGIRSSTSARRTGRCPCPTPVWAELVFPELEPGRAARTARARAPARAAARRGRPDRRVAGARRHAGQHRRAPDRAPLRCAPLRGPGYRPDGRPAAFVGLARGALPDRRRDRAHAEPPDRGGLHHARSGAHRGHRHVDQAARADRRDGRAGPRRALRGRARQPDGGLRAARRSRLRRHRRGAALLGEVALVDREGRSASSGRPSTTRCWTRTRRATSRSARASRSRSARTTATAPTSPRSTSTS